MQPTTLTQRQRLRTICTIFGTLALLSACGGGDGSDGLSGQNLALRTSVLPAGNNCPTGGNRFDAGPDGNQNGTLEDTEVTASTFVCNGLNGATGPAGAAGATGATGATGTTGATGPAGTAGATGATGATGTAGATGSAGAPSATGIAGVVGPQGVAGATGTTRFIRISPIAFGSLECAFGGEATEIGIDSNNNLVFEAGEVLSRTIVCLG